MKKKIAAVDIGTTKICTILGILDSDSGFRVLGIGIAPSCGIEKALVSDFDKARDSIRESVHKAELMAGFKLDSAYIGVTGRHITSINSKGNIAITRPGMSVRAADLKRAQNVALNINMPPDHQVLHIIPRSYKVDGFEVKDPVGMNASELEVDVHLITASTGSIQTLIKVINSLGIKVKDLILEPLASAEAVLREEEKEAGVLLADIGGGTTDIVIIKNGNICHSSVLPAAGIQITNDIVAGLGLSFELAEELKKKYGTLAVPEEGADKSQAMGEYVQNVSLQSLCEIMQIRVEEIIRLIVMDIPVENYRAFIPAGIVITGGCANTSGIVEMAERLTRLPVRIGTPATLIGVSAKELLNPAYATSVGLILYCMNNEGTSNIPTGRGIRGFMDRIFNVFK